jgi:hypothetical protein
MQATLPPVCRQAVKKRIEASPEARLVHWSDKYGGFALMERFEF